MQLKNYDTGLSIVCILCDRFVPTITTITGSYRIMKAWIPKQQSMQLKNSNTTIQVNMKLNKLATFSTNKKNTNKT